MRRFQTLIVPTASIFNSAALRPPTPEAGRQAGVSWPWSNSDFSHRHTLLQQRKPRASSPYKHPKNEVGAEKRIPVDQLGTQFPARVHEHFRPPQKDTKSQLGWGGGGVGVHTRLKRIKGAPQKVKPVKARKEKLKKQYKPILNLAIY